MSRSSVRTLSSIALAWSALACSIARPIDAQSPTRGRHRVAMSGALDAGTVPNAFSSRCGVQGSGSLGLGAQAAVLARVKRWLVMQADAHATTSTTQSDCVDVPPPRPRSANPYEERGGIRLPDGTPGYPLAMTMTRIGIETPAGPLIRLMAGGGAIWGGTYAASWAASIAVGSRGRETRWFGELQYAVSRTPATQQVDTWTYDPIGKSYVNDPRTIALLFHPRWTTLRAGVELPLGDAERMRHRLLGIFAVAACALPARGQVTAHPPVVPWPRQTLGIDAGVGSSLTNGLGSSCGVDPTVGIGVSAARRVLGIVVLEGAVGAHGTIDIGSCDYTVGAPNRTDATFRPTEVERGRDPSTGVLTTIVRAGLETPPLPGWRLRATGGAGRMWGAGLPFWTTRIVAVAGTSDLRFVIGAERWWYDLPVTGTSGQVPGSTLPIVILNARRQTHATFVRLGVELTLGRR